MPGNPRAIIAEAEIRFPIRIAIRVPPNGFGQRYAPMSQWLDENCGINGWSIAPAGTRGVLNDAVAVYVHTPTCAVGFVARWCVPGDPSGWYELRRDEPARRMPTPHHKTP
jgi:hypothetical protein